ncbi:Protoporphyrinogen oxidase [Yarrowia sp. C11]|nr:Protoporphyrinogen oxidase [Yarrowia sp. E02]KAG5367717.1 Protoporphyrinogen oxidase [Yarrowia sp. C11]
MSIQHTLYRPLKEGASLAILGGGIGGLLSAAFLARARPDIKITLYESKAQCGGWIKSKLLETHDGGSEMIEKGPRTLRMHPGTLILLQAISHVDPKFSIYGLPTDSPANTKWILNKDQLMSLSVFKSPGNLFRFLSSSVFRAMALGAFNFLVYPWTRKRDPNVKDESVAEFIGRRASPALGDRMGSAILHGIYAGDHKTLSARMTLRPFYGPDRLLKPAKLFTNEEFEELYKNLFPEASTSLFDLKKFPAMFAFPQGLSGMIDVLHKHLEKSPNVEIKCNTEITRVETTIGGMLVSDSTGVSTTHNAVYSLLSYQAVSKLLPDTADRALIKDMSSVDVMVLNFSFEKPKDPKFTGFGYLIPQAEENPEQVLGVIFDSDVGRGSELISGEPYKSPSGRENVTVMMGGHYWKDGNIPSSEECVERAKKVLKRHIGLEVTDKTEYDVELHKSCIPQYAVGHLERVDQFKHIVSKETHHRVALAGMSFGRGVGISDAAVDAFLFVASQSHDPETLKLTRQIVDHYETTVRL